MDQFIPCTLLDLPEDEWVPAAQVAAMINPNNAPRMEGITSVITALVGAEPVLPPAKLAVLVTKYWGVGGVKLTVGFMDNPPADVRAKIIAYANRWSKSANIKFMETGIDPQVRVDRSGSGYWSYLGTDILRIPKNKPTMNLQGFTMATRESEWGRVVPHEFGHTCGFPHEHMRVEIILRLDREKTLAYFRQTGWNDATTISNVLTPLNPGSINASPQADQLSIMCYQLPGSITKDGLPITGGTDLDPTDHSHAAKLYPRPDEPVPPPPPEGGRKIYVLAAGATEVKLSDVALSNLVITTTSDPGAVQVSFKTPTTGGGSMFGKLLAIWAAIRAGDYLTALRLLLELFEARQAGQISDAEFAAVEKALSPPCP